MPLDPRIALGGIQPTFSLFDLGATLRTGQQLQAGRLALTEEQRRQAEEEAIREAFRQQYGGGAASAGAPGPAPAGLAGVTPVQGRPLGGAPSAAFPGGPAQPLPYTQGTTPVDPRQARGPGVALPTPPPGPEAMTPLGQPQGLAGQAPADRQGQNRAFVSKLYTIDPKAAMQYEQHLTATTRAQYDAQKAQMDANVARVEFLGRVADGVLESGNPQQAWEVGRAMLIEQGMPPSQVPVVFDPSYVRQLSGMARDAKDKYNEGMLRLQQAKEQRERTEAGAKVPNYGLGQEANAVMHEMFGAQLPPGSAPTPAMTQRVNAERIRREREAEQAKQQGRIDVAAATGEKGAALTAQKTYDAAVAKPLEGPALQRVNMLMQGEDVVKALQSEFTPDERRKYVGLGGARMTVQQAQELLTDAAQGTGDPKYARFAALVALGKQEAFSTAGQALSQQERDIVYGYIPTGKEWSAEEFEQKLKLSGERLPTLIDRELTLSTTPRSELREKRRRGELPSMAPTTPTQAPQALTPMTEAMIADAMKQLGKSRAEVLALARKTKKYQVPAQ